MSNGLLFFVAVGNVVTENASSLAVTVVQFNFGTIWFGTCT